MLDKLAQLHCKAAHEVMSKLASSELPSWLCAGALTRAWRLLGWLHWCAWCAGSHMSSSMWQEAVDMIAQAASDTIPQVADLITPPPRLVFVHLG